MSTFRANRDGRRALAEETMRIIATGTSFSGAGKNGACQTTHSDRYQDVDVRERIAASVAGSVLVREPPAYAPAPETFATAFRVEDASTLAAARHLAATGREPCALVAARARKRERERERSSALYACQTAPRAAGFFLTGRANNAGLYTDAAVYAPAVPVWRDDAGGALLAAPYACAFVASAAPNRAVTARERVPDAAVDAALRRRIDVVLATARSRGHVDVVLGAWGCGVFRNPPEAVARAFEDALRGPHRGAFRTVVFAILGPAATRAPFAARFAEAPADPSEDRAA